MKQFYGAVKKLLPGNAARVIRKEFIVDAFVDANLAGYSLTQLSRTRFIAYLNRAPVFWFSKKPFLLETSSFGSEFVTMIQYCEYLYGLRYKLRMMRILINNPCFSFGDN